MNWITDRNKFDKISEKTLCVVYGKNYDHKDDESAPLSYYLAFSDEDHDFDEVFSDEKLYVKAAVPIWNPHAKWITHIDAKIASQGHNKFVVYGTTFAPGSMPTCDSDNDKDYYLCELKQTENYFSFGFFDKNNNRIWYDAFIELPALPEELTKPTVINRFNDLEHYYTVKLRGTNVFDNTGTKTLRRFEGKLYDVSEPVRVDNRTVTVAYKDQN